MHLKAVLGLLCATFSMTSLAAPTTLPPIEVSLNKTGAPIQPFVYGQFIEHLGRCIYGGIWAEMLEDRKFYFPITADYDPYRSLQDTAYPVVGSSPWQIIGASDAISMDTKDVFVGAHTPVLKAESGLRQRDLGTRKGRRYVGYLWAHSDGAQSAVEVSLGEADGHNRQTQTLQVQGADYARYAFSFTAESDSDQAVLEIITHKAGLHLGTLSLMPADNVHGLRKDTLQLLKELNSPIYRWPGGNFTSGYDWRDGIGDRDRRPPRKNPAWTGVEHNDFGTDEFLNLCRELGTEPMIAANTGFGDAYSAAQWVEYCNGPTTSLAGSWRSHNGHPEPYLVHHWCVGNEMFGPWQLGFMQLEHYTLKHNLVAEAMKAADPKLTLVGVGAIEAINKENDPNQAKRGISWSEGMLEACADHMDLISEHVYVGRVPWKSDIARLPLSAAVPSLAQAIHQMATHHRALQARLPNLKGKLMPVCLDEWNYWHREYQFGELGCPYDMADALGIAAGLHEIFRQSDLIQSAHYAQTVNVIGAIKTSRSEAQMETTGLVLALYRAHFGVIPVNIAASLPQELDVSAALSADGTRLTIAFINASTQDLSLPIHLAGRQPQNAATKWWIQGSSEQQKNEPGHPRAVDLQTQSNLDPTAPVPLPPLSCTLLSIPLN